MIFKALPNMYCLKSKDGFFLSPNSSTIILLKKKFYLFVAVYSHVHHLIDWQYFSGSTVRIVSSMSTLSIIPSGKCLLNSS